jgi:hypothetical protein
MNDEVQLSKWWRTPSAKAAMQRHEDAKKEKLAKLRATKAAEKAANAKELAEWEQK